MSRCLAFSEDFTGTGRGPHEHASPAAKQKYVIDDDFYLLGCFFASVGYLCKTRGIAVFQAKRFIHEHP